MRRFLEGFISCLIVLPATLFCWLITNDNFKEGIIVGLSSFVNYIIYGDEPGYYRKPYIYGDRRVNRVCYSGFNKKEVK